MSLVNLTRKVLRLTLVGLLVAITPSASALELKIPKPHSKFDLSHDFHVTLLTAAISQGADYSVHPQFTALMEMKENRMTRELIKGELLDVAWMGTDYNREAQLTAIPIPTTRGMIGYRKLLIRLKDKPLFDQITSLDQLKQYSACQGTGWPDTIILRNAGIRVETTPSLEDLYAMLAAKRCDFFPRGIHDHKRELAQRDKQYPYLMSYQEILIYYPFAVYFFVSKENKKLAQQIESGLERMIDNGQFDAILATHPLTKDVFPLTPQDSIVILSLQNNILSPGTDVSNQRYWIQPEDIGLKP